MDFQDLVDTPRKVKVVVGTITLLLLFPIYFASVPSLINGGVVEGRTVGLSGMLSISFEENETTISESILLDDGETYETIFDIDIENDKKGYHTPKVTKPTDFHLNLNHKKLDLQRIDELSSKKEGIFTEIRS